MAEALPIVVVGAGIAGLTTALALSRRGRAVLIVERAGRLDEVGAGIQLSPNASRILVELDLFDGLAASGVEPTGVVIRSASNGSVIAQLPLRETMLARYGAPFLVIHRGDLQAALVAAALRDPGITLHLGATVSGARETAGAIVVAVSTPSGESEIEADALVGADGVRSAVRTGLLGGPQAAYSGRIAWRATFPIDDGGGLDLTRKSGLWLGEKAHLVHYPIRGGRAVNVVAALDEPWTEDVWDVPGDPAAVAQAFATWPAPARDLIGLPDRWRKWALCAVPDAGSWASGRIALVGDAAHAMLPFVAQGGAMAIEDAAVLARLMSEGDRPMPQRLAEYERIRRPRATAVAATARRNAAVYHLAGLAAMGRDIGLRALGPRRLLERMDWIYGWRDDEPK
ncbi:MAG TPA: FAD-dependent oxidoreductase [Methylomirabilota bacterium]|nr:FAD-dependent oxidoreductase [Methylomirabilota bacterium]